MRNNMALKVLGTAAGAALLLWLARSRRAHGWLDHLETGERSVLAFELGGHVGRREIREMAATVLAAFERYDEIDMLVLLPQFTGLTPAAAVDLKALKAGVLSLGKVRRYAVVEPPVWAKAMIDISDWVMPVDARTFRMRQLPEAKSWVGERAGSVGWREALPEG